MRACGAHKISNLGMASKSPKSAFRCPCKILIYVNLESHIKMFNGCPLKHFVIVKSYEQPKYLLPRQ